MVKRLVTVPLWFISIWMMYGLAAYFLGLPDTGGAILGALVATFVCLDPTGAFFGTKVRIPTTPANRAVAETPTGVAR
jgi:hypothetical protein